MSDPTEPKAGVDPEEDVLEDVVRDCERSTHYTPKLRLRLTEARSNIARLRARAEMAEAIVERVAAIFRLIPKTPGDFSGLPAIVGKFAKGLETIAKQVDAAEAKVTVLEARLAEQNHVHYEAVRRCNDVATVLAAERRQAEEQAELERARADRAEARLANVVFEIDQCVELCGCEPGGFCESFGCGTLRKIRAVALPRRES